jgi:two-component system, LuxR family, sensor kinase FixL
MDQHGRALTATVTLTDLNRGHLRPTGISGLGAVPWGAHLCQFYDGESELLEILVPFFSAGLAANEFCMWITSQRVSVRQAIDALRVAVPEIDRLLAEGRIEILDFRDWYRLTGKFDSVRVRDGWIDRYHRALSRGFDGMRVTGDTAWLSEDEWEDFMHYEAQVDPIIGSSRMIALCTYSLALCDTRKMTDVIANHEYTLLREKGNWGAIKSYGRRRAEAALRQSEIRLRSTIEGATDGIINVDETGEITLANPAAAQMFGFTLDEILGVNISRLLQPPRRRARQRRPRDLLKLMDRGYFRRHREMEWRHKDGVSAPVECAVSEIKGAGPCRQFVLCLNDLTERRQIEASLQQLHSDRLIAMGGMATTLAHEINQPLTATAVYLKAAKRMLDREGKGQWDAAAEALEKASDQILRAGSIIRHMREFVAHDEPNKTHVSLHELIAGAFELTVGMVRHANVGLTLDLKAESDAVLVDMVQLRQVMVNLIRNAIDAMSAVSVRSLTISTFVSEAGIIQTNVRDSGPGLSEEVAARLFEPFRTTKQHGLGVGLSLSKSIIEAHYGRIWAEANEDGGATFCFSLPLSEAFGLAAE